MTNYAHILGIDPSGNKAEGVGETGLALLHRADETFQLGEVLAKDYETQHRYWYGIVKRVKDMVDQYPKGELLVVIEDYRLDPGRAAAQFYSQLETPKLIGVLQFMLNNWRIPHMLQQAAVVKKRWSDEILLKKGILTCGAGNQVRYFYYNGTLTNNHKRDAMRHAWHVHAFNKEPK